MSRHITRCRYKGKVKDGDRVVGSKASTHTISQWADQQDISRRISRLSSSRKTCLSGMLCGLGVPTLMVHRGPRSKGIEVVCPRNRK